MPTINSKSANTCTRDPLPKNDSLANISNYASPVNADSDEVAFSSFKPGARMENSEVLPREGKTQICKENDSNDLTSNGLQINRANDSKLKEEGSTKLVLVKNKYSNQSNLSGSSSATSLANSPQYVLDFPMREDSTEISFDYHTAQLQVAKFNADLRLHELKQEVEEKGVHKNSLSRTTTFNPPSGEKTFVSENNLEADNNSNVIANERGASQAVNYVTISANFKNANNSFGAASEMGTKSYFVGKGKRLSEENVLSLPRPSSLGDISNASGTSSKTSSNFNRGANNKTSSKEKMNKITKVELIKKQLKLRKLCDEVFAKDVLLLILDFAVTPLNLHKISRTNKRFNSCCKQLLMNLHALRSCTLNSNNAILWAGAKKLNSFQVDTLKSIFMERFKSLPHINEYELSVCADIADVKLQLNELKKTTSTDGDRGTSNAHGSTNTDDLERNPSNELLVLQNNGMIITVGDDNNNMAPAAFVPNNPVTIEARQETASPTNTLIPGTILFRTTFKTEHYFFPVGSYRKENGRRELEQKVVAVLLEPDSLLDNSKTNAGGTIDYNSTTAVALHESRDFACRMDALTMREYRDDYFGVSSSALDKKKRKKKLVLLVLSPNQIASAEDNPHYVKLL